MHLTITDFKNKAKVFVIKCMKWNTDSSFKQAWGDTGVFAERLFCALFCRNKGIKKTMREASFLS